MKYVLLTQGQGAQTVHMAREFYDEFPIFKQTLEEACDLSSRPIARWIYEDSLEELSRTDRSQLALYTTTIGIFRVLKQLYPEIAFTYGVGLSLGEYSVLTIADALSFTDGVRLVMQRGDLMQEASDRFPGKMAAVLGMPAEEIEKYLPQGVSIANRNTPMQTVISGDALAVEKCALVLKANGAKRVVFLDVQGAFHSPLMQEAYEKFKDVLADVPLQNPSFPIIMNATAKPSQDKEEIRTLLAKQLISSVRFSASIQFLGNQHSFLELGPGSIVGAMVEKNIATKVISINNIAQLKGATLCAC